MNERQADEALEKLNRRVEESRKSFQRQTMEQVQEYFDETMEDLKRQVYESRSRLESLSGEIPGGQDESFQALSRELADRYSKAEECLEEVRRDASGLDLEELGHRREDEASAAARREASERSLDLDEVPGTGTEGRVLAEDVKSDKERQTGEPEATDAARREARDRGIDLSEVQATGAEGQIIISDVVEYAQAAESSAVDSATGDSVISDSAIGDSVAELTGYEAIPGAADEAGSTLKDQIPNGQGASESPTGRAARETENGEEPKATSAARRKAEEFGVSLSDVAGTGSGGQITVSDVTGAAEDDRGAVGQAPRQTRKVPRSSTSRTADGKRDKAQEAVQQTDVSGEPLATNAARSRAEKLGVDLSRVKGSGVGGLITTKDVLGARSRG